MNRIIFNKQTGHICKQIKFKGVSEYPCLFWENSEPLWEVDKSINPDCLPCPTYNSNLWFVDESELYIEKATGYIIRYVNYVYYIWDMPRRFYSNTYSFRVIKVCLNNFLEYKCIPFKNIVDYSNKVKNVMDIFKYKKLPVNTKPIVFPPKNKLSGKSKPFAFYENVKQNQFADKTKLNETWKPFSFYNENQDFYDKFNHNFSKRSELDEFAIVTIQNTILNNKDKMTLREMDLMLNHICECIYN
tara:strand:+ start:444 stop:1178 length:735 start_codon:yes stop_codon:yes gene_type:complete